MINSCQQYNKSKDEERAPKVYRCQQINKSEDKEKQDLPADYKNDRYIPLPLLKVLNCLVNLGKEIRSRPYLISIESKKY